MAEYGHKDKRKRKEAAEAEMVEAEAKVVEAEADVVEAEVVDAPSKLVTCIPGCSNCVQTGSWNSHLLLHY